MGPRRSAWAQQNDFARLEQEGAASWERAVMSLLRTPKRDLPRPLIAVLLRALEFAQLPEDRPGDRGDCRTMPAALNLSIKHCASSAFRADRLPVLHPRQRSTGTHSWRCSTT